MSLYLKSPGGVLLSNISITLVYGSKCDVWSMEVRKLDVLAMTEWISLLFG